LWSVTVECDRGSPAAGSRLPKALGRSPMFARTRIALAAAVAALSLAVAAAPASAGTLDQQFIPVPPATNAPIGGSGWKAQSFEAGATGALDQVDLLLWKQPTTAVPLTVEIRTLSGGVPSQTVLASASVLAADVPTGIGAQNWVSVPLIPPAPSVAGTQYAIVLSAPSATSTSAYEWVVSSGTAATYADGSFFRSFTSGASWMADAFDNGFKTYVTVLLPTGKAQCKKGGWRNYPQFKNQGRCVRFVVTGKLHTSSPGSKAQGGGKSSKAPK
jgi:hypothetical protein